MATQQPRVLSQDEIRTLLTEVTDVEFAEAKTHSLTKLKRQILFEGTPGGATVRDIQGNEYIDCTSQAWSLNVGYNHPDVIAAVTEQMRHLTHVRYAYPTIPRIKLLNKLPKLFPGNLNKVVLNNQGGGSAIEAAMKLAMINKPGATVFLTAYRAYHGCSLGTYAASQYFGGISRFSGFGMDHFAKFPYPYCYRCQLQLEPQHCGLACLQCVEDVIYHGVNAPIAGLIIEPMQGAGGQVPTPPGYLAGLKEICQRHGIYLIYDESQTAFGRCGAMSAAEYYGVAPDMMALTKGLGGGFAVGALLAREDLKNLNAAEEHTTFGSSPVAFAAALATIEVMERLGLCERSRQLGERATARLLHLQEEHPLIGEVRGPGLFIGVELVEDPKTRTPATERAAALVELGMMSGVIFDVDMPEVHAGCPTCRNTIKIKPPLTIPEEQLDRALQVFEELLVQVEQMDQDALAMVREQLAQEASSR